jgi:hypothetical protein
MNTVDEEEENEQGLSFFFKLSFFSSSGLEN